MAVLDHWHPISAEKDLRDRPKKVRLDGRYFVLFRTSDGRAAALDNVCVHRRADLSLGCIVEGKLRCGYHGWCYDAQGNAESPGTPKLRAITAHYETHSAHGYIWMRRAGSQTRFPVFEVDGYRSIANLDYTIRAPLELVLDNFTEVEHTPTTHANFGYELSRMHEVTTEIESTTDTVRVVNHGPQKRTPWFINTFAGLRSGDRFTDDWTTYFSPVYTVYDQFWNDPRTGAERPNRYRIYVFFNPIDADQTQLVVFAYLRAADWLQTASARFARLLHVAMLDREVRCDVRMLESLADPNPAIEGMKLSRFDRVLGLNRERIRTIYRGSAGQNGETKSAVRSDAAGQPTVMETAKIHQNNEVRKEESS